MRSVRRLALAGALALAACGGGISPSRGPTATQALTETAELLEFETPATRQELFRELARTSQTQAGRKASGPVLFPVIIAGEVVAARGLDTRADLLQAPDAGVPLQLSLDLRWPEERRDSLQGLSEREAAELVARTLLAHWGIRPTGVVQVDRTPGAPYAAAYMDGLLRINPALLYLAASGFPSPQGGLQ